MRFEFRLTPAARRLLLSAGLLVGMAAVPLAALSDPPATTAEKPTAPMNPAKDIIRPEAWKAASTARLQPGEIDRLVAAALKSADLRPEALTSDEEFIRRAYLDLTGKLPSPGDVREFLTSEDRDKRARLIDRLLESDDYARYWAGYWRNVVSTQVTDVFGRLLTGHFERWMTEQLKKNVKWDKVARDIITAKGEMRFNEPDKNGAAFLILSRRGQAAVEERAAEVSRLFLGIQIQCAQCHDHPFDDWKRQQFHEFAAFLSRTRDRLIREEQRFVGASIVSVPFGEHRMEDLKDPSKKTPVSPRFLDGQKPRGLRLGDEQRRAALADYITSKDNPWFAAAFVNRIWGELMGQSFYQPVDDLGPQREAVMPAVMTRLAGSFRGSDYDVKQLFRDIMNTETYQRKIRLGKAVDEHQMFAGVYPKRLQGEALWNSLECVLGRIDAPFGKFGRGPGGGPFGRFAGPKGQFLREFNYDPSSRPEDVEGSIPQALLLMNNPGLNQKMKASGANLLAKLLKTHAQDEDAVKALYVQVFARQPTERELQRCLSYIREVGNRAEAFEDILWVLINSTEFQTKR